MTQPKQLWRKVRLPDLPAHMLKCPYCGEDMSAEQIAAHLTCRTELDKQEQALKGLTAGVDPFTVCPFCFVREETQYDLVKHIRRMHLDAIMEQLKGPLVPAAKDSELVKDLVPVFNMMLAKLNEKIPENGYSYRGCELSTLIEGMMDHVRALRGQATIDPAPSRTSTFDEAIHVANYAIMLAFRLARLKG